MYGDRGTEWKWLEEIEKEREAWNGKQCQFFFLFLFSLCRSLIVYFFLFPSWCLCVCGSHSGKEYKLLINMISWVPLQIRIVCSTNECESCGITFPLLFCKCCYCGNYSTHITQWYYILSLSAVYLSCVHCRQGREYRYKVNQSVCELSPAFHKKRSDSISVVRCNNRIKHPDGASWAKAT